MSTCPPTDLLEQRLTGTLAEPVAAGVDEHVQVCPRCQAWLAERTEHAELRCLADRARQLPESEAALVGLLDRLRGLNPHGTDRDTPPAAEATLTLAPGSPGELGVLGPYRIEAELGRGGMGIVYRARDEALQRTVAVKVLRPERADAAAQERLLREAQIAARFRHDHVVTVHAIATLADGSAYLVMEYLEGPTLAELIRTRGRLAPAEAASIASQVAEGLAAAHAAGLIHRDVKPSNIILDTQTNRAKILDFGLARLPEASAALTQEGVVAGTPTYMSPEQIHRRAPLDGRVDVYGLGVTLYEALTGEVPFRGTPAGVLRQVLEDEPRPPRALNDAVPRDLETICIKAMAKEPHRRYATATDLAEDLRRWLRGEPIHARAVGRREKMWWWCRRNPSIAGLSLTVLVILLAGMAGTSWQAWIARENARRADDARVVADNARVVADNARVVADNARVVAEQRRDFAEKGQLVALRAVDYFYTKVSEEQLLHHPQLLPLRRKLLGAALASYRNFVQTHQENPRLVLQTALTAYRLAGIVGEIGSTSESESAQREAIAWLDKALDSNPADTDLRIKRANCHMELGKARHRRGELKLALVSLQQAAALCEGLLAEDPKNRDLLGNLCACHGEIANLHLSRREPKLALTAYERIQSHLQSIAQTDPANLGIQRTLGVNTHNIAMAYEFIGQNDKSIQWFEQAHVIRRRLADKESHPGMYMHDLARTALRLAELCRQVGKASQAAVYYREAIDSLEKVVKTNPAKWEYRQELAGACLHLGTFLAKEKKPDEALRAYEQGAEAAHRVLAIAPKALPAKVNLATILLASGSLHLHRDQPVAALPLLKEAVALEKELMEGPGPVTRQARWADDCRKYGTALYLTGRRNEALAMLEEGVKHARLAFENEKDSQKLFETGCELALVVAALGKNADSQTAVVRQKYVAEAVALLRRAILLDAKWRQQLMSRAELTGLRGERAFLNLQR